MQAEAVRRIGKTNFQEILIERQRRERAKVRALAKRTAKRLRASGRKKGWTA